MTNLARLCVCVVVVLCITTLPAASFAQTVATGNIEGMVTDTSGGVLPGVTVVVRHTGTNVTREVVTDASGRYRAVALQPAVYEVRATLAGFDAKALAGIAVHVGQTAAVDVQMRPAGVTESVTVAAEAPLIDTRRTDVSNVISQEAIENLPINGRRWDSFVMLSPGVTNDGNFGLVTYRGISGLYNNNMIDGIDNNQAFFSEARGRTRTVYSVSQSAIKEFQVGISNMSAEFGRAAGGTVNAVTKSGANRASGEAFYFLRDRSFQAKNPFITLPNDPTAKPEERRQQFGIGVGGPLKRDKVFFFVDYDQQVRDFPVFVSPNNANFLTSACTAPAANCASSLNFFNSIAGLSPRDGNNRVTFARVDVAINQNNNLALSYNGHRWNSANGIQTQAIVSVASSANGDDVVRTDFVVGSLNTIVSERWLNELRFQVGRDYEEQMPYGTPPGTSVTGGINFGMPSFLPRYAFPHEQRFQFVDALTYYHGGHSIKLGADLNFVRDLQINLFQGGGVYSYPNLTAIAQDCPKGGTGCTAAETGATTGRHYSNYQQSFDRNNLGGKIAFNTVDYNFYVQDTWRVNNQLLLNLGLRYEYQQLPQPGEVKVDDVTFAGNPAYPLTQRFAQDKKDWGPRVGATYDLGNKHTTVVRGSYGIFYGRTSNSAIANALINNAVSVASYFMTPTTAGAPTYPNTLNGPPTIAGSRPDIQYFSPDLKRPMIQSVDATLDRQIFEDTTVSVSYLFSRGSRLPFFRDTNFNPANSQVTYVLDGQAVGTFPFYRGARPDQNVTRSIIMESAVTTRYNALVLSVNKRFSKGLLFNAHYTVAKSQDREQSSTTFFGGNQPYDTLNLDLVDGQSASDFDRRHRFVASFHYRPDFLGGIGIGGIVTAESGLPASQNISGSLPAASGATNTSGTNGTGGAGFAPWLGRNTDRFPGRKTFDLRASKRFTLGNRKYAEVLWEMFNVFNTVNYTGSSTTAYNVASSFYDAAANMAFVTVTRNSGYLVPTSASNNFFGPRDMQLGLKFIW